MDLLYVLLGLFLLYVFMNKCGFNNIEGMTAPPENATQKFCREKYDKCLCSRMNNSKSYTDNSNKCSELSDDWQAPNSDEPCSNISFTPSVAGGPQKGCCEYYPCNWYGKAPACDGSCPPGWLEIESSNKGDGSTCWTGAKKLCIKDPNNPLN